MKIIRKPGRNFAARHVKLGWFEARSLPILPAERLGANGFWQVPAYPAVTSSYFPMNHQR